MASIKLDSKEIKKLAQPILARIVQKRQEIKDREIQKAMRGFFGLFKRSKEDAEKSLQGDIWNQYNLANLIGGVQHSHLTRLLALAEKSDIIEIGMDSAYYLELGE